MQMKKINGVRRRSLGGLCMSECYKSAICFPIQQGSRQRGGTCNSHHARVLYITSAPNTTDFGDCKKGAYTLRNALGRWIVVGEADHYGRCH